MSSPNSTVGSVHSGRPIGAVTPNASPSGKQGGAKKPAKPATAKKPTKKGKR